MPQGTQERGEDQLTALFPPGTGVSPGAMSPGVRSSAAGFPTGSESAGGGTGAVPGSSPFGPAVDGLVRRGESPPQWRQALGEAGTGVSGQW